MKKKVLIAGLLVVFLYLTVGPSLALDKDDYQVIKKAVQENPKSQPVAEAKWFKVLVIDKASGQEKVKVTLPITLVEMLVNCAGDKDLKMTGRDDSLKVQDLMNQLKKAGPMSIIEVNDEEEMVKIWIE
ncbi:MAG TPA: hypothetical protein PKU99_10300 [Candidatus Saccharicenans sp.]|nr:hypothetical protein [Candidatus Saccharicenans sp.]